MRRLEQGDTVEQVYNVSRIIGLDACEGILLVGKDALYLMDNVFQCRDGEIVHVWQAPVEERDPFSQIIGSAAAAAPNGSGGGGSSSSTTTTTNSESRHWLWSDVISVSKRRFLFRDVALEVFFRDGRSYLLTMRDNSLRNDVYGKLTAKIPMGVGLPSGTDSNNNNHTPNPVEDSWRLEALRALDPTSSMPSSLGSKLGSLGSLGGLGGIFNASSWNPSMRRWQRGDMSNFHYLMLVNTMAGRTFNDLTQYPVFPWVLADYTSDELDLDDPATFRDLSRPMGAQTAQRQADFAMRYQTLAEMGQPHPFHYGTHYSSAMVVSSYLLRLPPFVDSFLLLQGGHFDHPDRLFYSVEAAWKSASRDNGADVRELIPEFFCLPEFLVNLNGYDLGRRQDGSAIDNVRLPPWAHGDPHLFVAKHRQALESPYVSAHLHQWIDLVFGCKQRGDAAVEALNVFHHLSYQGAIDLDNIVDPQERAIVTGIIHNFGQTPHQVFAKPHPPREVSSLSSPDKTDIPRLDNAAASLVQLPRPILESRERVASLLYVPHLDRLLCASPYRLNRPPLYDAYLEWGYPDHSLRFFASDAGRRPLGLVENLHMGPIAAVAFADAHTLITAGSQDCAVSVHSVVTTSSSGNIDLVARASLFGHAVPVAVLAVSGPLRTLVTVDRNGVVLFWDLNRLEFVRRVQLPVSAESPRCASLHDTTGDLLIAAGRHVFLYTLNGHLLVDHVLDPGDDVYACAFYEGAAGSSSATAGVAAATTAWPAHHVLLTGHRRGIVRIWRKEHNGHKWVLALDRPLAHVVDGVRVEAAMTCIAPMAQVVYTGDEEGRVVSF